MILKTITRTRTLKGGGFGLTKWKMVFEKHERGDLIDPDTGMLFNAAARFKQMKPLVREFFRNL